MAAVVKVEKSEEFYKVLTDAGSHLVVVHFSASWAPQCQQMNDVLTELSKDPQLSAVRFLEIDAEGVAEISQKYQVIAVPTCLFFKNKAKVDRLDGAKVAELSKRVKQLAAGGSDPISSPVSAPKQDLNTRLKTLITAAPIMLFIKGTPEEPRCGFSRQLIQILNEKNINYSTFNILADEEVRQGLKTYSNWPTYPQVYCNGELVGGLDIIKELDETGQLESELKAGGDNNLEERRRAWDQSPVLTAPDGTLAIRPDPDSAADCVNSADNNDCGQIPETRTICKLSRVPKSESADKDEHLECSECEFMQNQHASVNALQQNHIDVAFNNKEKIETVKQNYRKRKKLEDCVSQLKEDCLSSGVLQTSDSSSSHCDVVKIKTEPSDHSELQFCYDQDVIGHNFASAYHSNLNYNHLGVQSYPSSAEMSARNKRKRNLNNMWKVNLREDSESEYNKLHKFHSCQQKTKRQKLLPHEANVPEFLSVIDKQQKMLEQNYNNRDHQCSEVVQNMHLSGENNHNKMYNDSENMDEGSVPHTGSLVDVKEEMDSYFSSHLNDFSDMCNQSSDDSQYQQDDIGEEWLPSSGQKRKYRNMQKSTKCSPNTRRRTKFKLTEEIRRQKNTEYRRKRRQELKLSNPEKLREEREKDRQRKQMLRKRNQLLLSLPPDLLSEAAGLAGNSGILDETGNPLSVPFPFSPGDDIEDLKEKEEQRRAINRDRMRMKRMQMDGLTKEKIKQISREKMRQRRAQLRENDPVAAALEREKQKLKKREERKRNAILLSLPNDTLKEAANNTEILQAAIASLTEGTASSNPLTQLPLDAETASNLAKLRAHLEMKRAEAAERVRRKRAEMREKDPAQAAAIREREKIRKRIERRRNTLLLSLPPDELVRVTVASINEGDNVPFQLPSLLALSSSSPVNHATMTNQLPTMSAESSDPALSPVVPHLTEELVKMREKLEKKRALDRERMRQRRAKLKENPEAAAAFKEKERLRKQMERWKKSMGLFDSTKPLDTPSLDPALFVPGISGNEGAESSFINKSLLSVFSLGSQDFSNPSQDNFTRCTEVSQGQSVDSHNFGISNSVSSLNLSGSSVDSNFSVSNSSSVKQRNHNAKQPISGDTEKQNGEHTKTMSPLPSNDCHSVVKTELSLEEVDRFPKGFDLNEEQDIQMDVVGCKQHDIQGSNLSHPVAQLVSPNVMRIVPSLYEDGAPSEDVPSQLSSADQLDHDVEQEQEKHQNERPPRRSESDKSCAESSGAGATDMVTCKRMASESPLKDDTSELAAMCVHDPNTLKRAQEWFIYQLSVLQNKMGDRFLQLDPNPKHLDPLPGGIAAQLTPLQLLLVQQLIGPMPVVSDSTAASQALDPHAFEMKLMEMMIKGYEYREQNRTRARNYRDRLKHDPDYKEKYEQKKLRDLERKRIHRARESELRQLYPEYNEARQLQHRQRRSRHKGKKKRGHSDSDDSQSDTEMLQFEMSDGTNDPLVQDLNRVTSDIFSVYSKLDRDQNQSYSSTDKASSGYNLRELSSAKKLKFVYDENYDDLIDFEPSKSTNVSKSKATERRLPYKDSENSSDSDEDDDSFSDDDESSTLLDTSQ